VKLCQFAASLYLHMLANVGLFSLMFNKMALIFLGVLVVFTVSISFEFQVRLYWFHRQGQVALYLPYLSPLDYQVWGQCWSLNTRCNRSQNQFLSFKMHFS